VTRGHEDPFCGKQSVADGDGVRIDDRRGTIDGREAGVDESLTPGLLCADEPVLAGLQPREVEGGGADRDTEVFGGVKVGDELGRDHVLLRRLAGTLAQDPPQRSLSITATEAPWSTAARVAASRPVPHRRSRSGRSARQPARSWCSVRREPRSVTPAPAIR